jgi:DNA primase
VLLFDPDAAGERAALRAAERALSLLKPGFGLRFAFLDTETRDDPDGVVRRYPKQFLEQTLARSLAFSEFIFRTETRGRRLETAEDRAALAQRLRQRASAIADADLRRQFLSGWRQRLWEASSRRGRDSSESGGKSLKVSPLPSVAVCLAAAPPTQRASAESSLVRLLLHDPQLFVEVEDEIGSISFAESELDRLRQALIALLSATSGDCDADALDTALRAQGLGATLDRVMRDSSTFRSTQDPVPKQRDSDMEILSRASLSELQNMSFSDPLAEQCRKEVIAKSEPPAKGDRNAQVPVSHSSGRDGTADRVGGEPLNDRMKDDARSQWIAAMSVLRRLALREELSALRAEGLSPEAWARQRALIEEARRQSDD